MSDSYRAAVIGCGSIGHAHCEGYQLNKNVELVAVVDPLALARAEYMDKFNIPHGYASIGEMLSAEHPDLVSICLWHPLHPEATIAAARGSARAVICEKPMAISLGAAHEMIDVCAEQGTRLVISHQRRFTPGWERARDLVAAGAIGEPLQAHCQVRDGLLNCGTHAIDGARFVLGEPSAQWVVGAVDRHTNRFERDTPIEDGCMGLVQFNNVLQLFIQVDLVKDKGRAGAFFIRGSEGMIDVSESRVMLFNSASAGWRETDLGLPAAEIKAIGGNTNGQQVAELIEWIEGGPVHRCAATTAIATVEIMMALYESARCHQVVGFPLAQQDYPLQLMIDDGLFPTEGKRYDIRQSLKRDHYDEATYLKLRGEGLDHTATMEKLSTSSSS